MKTRIMIVEDESIVAMEIEEQLLQMGHEPVGVCATADEAVAMAIRETVDVILMDIELLEGSGIDAARRIREQREIPVIYLTAYMDESTIEKAVATDPAAYLTKPYNIPELKAAIRIALKNSFVSDDTSEAVIHLDDEFSFDHERMELTLRGESLHLTRKEKKLLKLFLDHPNTLVSNSTIEHTIWPDEPVSDNTRRVLMSRLRNKLKHKFIETSVMEGYVFHKEGE